MLRVAAAMFCVASSFSSALAGPKSDAPADDQVAIVNAAANLGDVGQISRLSRVLDGRGMLFKLSDKMAATLDGRASLIDDIDAIRETFANTDYTSALKMID